MRLFRTNTVSKLYWQLFIHKNKNKNNILSKERKNTFVVAARLGSVKQNKIIINSGFVYLILSYAII